MKSRGQVDLLKAAIMTGTGLIGSVVVWFSSATWSRYEFAANQARQIAEHERQVTKIGERQDKTDAAVAALTSQVTVLVGQTQRMEAAAKRSVDAAERSVVAAESIESVAARLEAKFSRLPK